MLGKALYVPALGAAGPLVGILRLPGSQQRIEGHRLFRFGLGDKLIGVFPEFHQPIGDLV
jgi:hypothetical protein